MTDYDAHDEISDLQKSISMLEQEIETWKSLYFSAEKAAKQNKEEVDRLREALERIANTEHDWRTVWFHDVARAALAEKEETK